MAKKTAPHEYVRMSRERLGWTQGEMARALGQSSYRTVARWEHGERETPTMAVMLLRIWQHPDGARFIPKIRGGK